MNLADRYLELLKSSLLNTLNLESEAQLMYAVSCAAHDRVMPLSEFTAVRRNTSWLGALRGARAVGTTVQLEGRRRDGSIGPDPSLRNHSEFAHTLVGRARLDQLQAAIETVLHEGIPGDLLEAGVWRGGACILMRGVLAAHSVRDRRVWVADSFAGLPNSEHPADGGFQMDASVLPFLAVSRNEVAELFERYGLLDEQVGFIEGFFSESLPRAPLGPLAVLRLDADLYVSTRDALRALYPKLSPGGFVIVDDYLILPPCRAAVDDYLAEHGIQVDLSEIDAEAVYFRKP